MSNRYALPDVIVEPDGLIRLVSVDAQSWTRQNTNIRDTGGIQDRNLIDHSALEVMASDGLVVMWRKHDAPVRQERIKIRGDRSSHPDEFDRHRAKFEGLTLEKYRRQIRAQRALAKFRADHHRRMQERDEKHLETLQDEGTDQ